ncbi:uncharacterized protein LOC131679683 [Topomyia yanbarensis]|uniref:uncharacterized protein LOC131679683 n=1 Tax=Topomyia yanbarensis TaxID=2498891 RepID=UPI00273CA586|nr:uncharacterized protein LOC131679683 [Topomyia yanbarensis]
MSANQWPPGGGPSPSQTIPSYLNSGDNIDQQTLLLRAAGDENGISGKLPTNPFLIHLTLKNALGTEPTKYVSAVKEARGTQYALRTSSKRAYDRLLKIDQLADGQKVEIIPHPFLNKVQGLLFDLDTANMETSSILEALKEQRVIEFRRITKIVDKSPVNTPLLVLSFSGSHLPEEIFLGMVRVKIRRYYPSPMQCFRCGKFGHGSKACNQKEVCLNCSGEHQVIKGVKCNEESKCINCGEKHSARDRQCPVQMKEAQIIKLKTDRNLTFPEARALINQTTNKNTFADALKKNLTPTADERDITIRALTEEVDKLKKLVANRSTAAPKDDEIKRLNDELTSSRKENKELKTEMAALRKSLEDIKKHLIAKKAGESSKPMGPPANIRDPRLTSTDRMQTYLATPETPCSGERRSSRNRSKQEHRVDCTDKSRSPINKEHQSNPTGNTQEGTAPKKPKPNQSQNKKCGNPVDCTELISD